MKPKPNAASQQEQACFMLFKLKHPDIVLQAPDHWVLFIFKTREP